MNEKQFYTSPEVDVLVVRFEGVICTSPNGTEEGSIVNGSWDA